MSTQQIDQSEWTQWLNEWSKQHIGKPVHIKEFGQGTGSHEAVKGLPFAGFVVELDSPEGPSIVVIAGTESSDHVSHTIVDPKQVWWKSGEDEPDEVVEIRSSDSTTTVLQFAADH